MSDEVQTQSPTATVVHESAAPSSSPALPADYDTLKSFYDTYSPAVPTIQRIAERWEDVQPFIEDGNEEAEFMRKARTSYKREREAAQPQLSPELKLIRDEFRGELGPVIEYVKSEQQQRKEAAEATQKSSLDANYAYAQRLCAERPELAEHNFAGINMLAQVAYRDGKSLEDAYKTYGSMLAARVEKATPPPSLHGGSAAPGIPGPSTQAPIKSRKDLRARLAANIKAGSR